MSLFTKQKHTHRHRKQTVITKGERRREGGMSGIQLTDTQYYIKINKDLLYSIRNYIQYFIIDYKGKESEYITESLAIHLKHNIIHKL